MAVSAAMSDALTNFDAWQDVMEEHDIDPYIFWVLATEFRGLGQRGALPGVLNLIAELKEPITKGITKETLLNPNPIETGSTQLLKGYIPDAYFEAYPGINKQGTKFVTLRLNMAAADGKLTAASIRDRLLLLVKSSSIQRVQLGFPRGDLIADPGAGNHDLPEIPKKEKAAVLLAAVEDTCPFYHHALHVTPGGPGTKVQVLWDQTTLGFNPTGLAPRLFPYGRQWDKKGLDAWTDAQSDADEDWLSENWTLETGLKGRFASLRGRVSHGAAVLGVLAGYLPTAALPMDGVLDGEGASFGPNPGSTRDWASAAPLAVVQLPREQTQISSGRWLAPSVLDALRYLQIWGWRYTNAQGKQTPMVVNISYGSQAGPHDGTGILEQAMQEMVQHHGADLALVLAAGNSHGTDRDVEQDHVLLASGVHAQAKIERGSSARFVLHVPPDKQSETALEIWFEKEIERHQFTVTVWPPDAKPHTTKPTMNITLPGMAWQKNADAVIAGLIGQIRVAQSAKKSMALLMIAATQQSTTKPEASAGEWLIEVTNNSDQPHVVNLWVERDDAVVGAKRGQQARLLPVSRATPGTLNDGNTFTNLTSGKSTLVVTALRAGQKPSVYSSEGTSERMPDLSAWVDPLSTAHGMRVMGNRSGVVVRANGTSLAAPQAARWVANQLAIGVTLNQIQHDISKAPRTTRKGLVIP